MPGLLPARSSFRQPASSPTALIFPGALLLLLASTLNLTTCPPVSRWLIVRPVTTVESTRLSDPVPLLPDLSLELPNAVFGS